MHDCKSSCCYTPSRKHLQAQDPPSLHTKTARYFNTLTFKLQLLFLYWLLAIGADDIQKGKSMLRRASGTKLPLESSDGGFDDADCTGGSCTGEDTSTGDSGFGDVGPLLKVKPVCKPQPTVQLGAKPMSAIATGNYYKRLGTPDYIDYYSTVTTKESCDIGPGIGTVNTYSKPPWFFPSL